MDTLNVQNSVNSTKNWVNLIYKLSKFLEKFECIDHTELCTF